MTRSLVVVRLDPIRIVPYDPEWNASFEKYRQPLEVALASALVRPVEHIGSTAVPGLASKPIVDMLAVVSDIDNVDMAAVTDIGWLFAPEPSDEAERRRSFCTPSVEHRTHHLHVVEQEFESWRQWLAFRDHLRCDPETARRYAELKIELASAHGDDPNDRAPYRQGKSAFIDEILGRSD